MKAFPIPVVALGPGTQSPFEEDALDYLPMPSGMDTFSTPRLPDEVAPAARDAAIALLEGLADAMAAWSFTHGAGGVGHPVVDLSTVPAAVCALVNDALGQGEVSACYTPAGADKGLRVQETVFAGVWRLLDQDAPGQPGSDRIEACAFPPAALPRAGDAPAAFSPDPAPAGAMNAPAVMHELLDAAACHRPGQAAHIINLTLLPMTPADLNWLVASLGIGPTVILSRGYGNCRITSTRVPHVWWVQYFNSADTLILNTLEVTDLPDVAPAAADDFADSLVRLREWTDSLRDL